MITDKIKGYYNILRWKCMSKRIQGKVDVSDVSLISMNCIGGMLYHDLGQKFLSPTVNLFFTADDFIKFVSNLPYYLSLKIKVSNGEDYPIGILDDIKVYFMHFKNAEEAYKKWEERKKRINLNKIFVIMVEQNGFSDKNFEDFQNIKYPKFLFTKTEKYSCKDSLYMPKYRSMETLPDIIPGRHIYDKMALIKAINGAFDNNG
ncbi:MAG: DUF1919 domain-containing protein [Acutalibacteraceae bacterium]